MKAKATMTSKGQVTIPACIRERVGLRAGVRLTFSARPDNTIVLTTEDAVSPFAPYQGRGNPGVDSGRQAIDRYLSALRGYDDLD